MVDDDRDFLACLSEPLEPLTWEEEKAYARRELRRLETDFIRDGNPVYACLAIHLAHRYELNLPEWIMTAAMTEVIGMYEEVLAGKPIVKEAERVGRAFGFGGDGRGQSGSLQQAASIRRDEQIYAHLRMVMKPMPKKVAGELYFAPREKLDIAYDIVAAERGIARSTVVKAAGRVLERKRAAVTDDDSGENLRTMSDHVKFTLRRFQQALEVLKADHQARKAKRESNKGAL